VSAADHNPTPASETSVSSEPKHRTFSLTPSRSRPLREQLARAALIIGGFLFIASAVVLCFCPEFYVGIFICGVIAAWLGCRRQRIAGVIMLSLALIVGVLGYLT
jgi:hypothetical protein